jgi:hypothetical protein
MADNQAPVTRAALAIGVDQFPGKRAAQGTGKERLNRMAEAKRRT